MLFVRILYVRDHTCKIFSCLPGSFVDLGNIEGSLVSVVNEYKGHCNFLQSNELVEENVEDKFIQEDFAVMNEKHNWLQYILLMLYMKIKSFFSFIAICNFYGTKCLDSDDDDHGAK